MKFARKHIRLPAENYLGARDYFLTVCCRGRQPLLARKETALQILEQLRTTAARSGFAIHAYCLMPDHLHFLVEGLSEKSDLLGFVSRFKQTTAYEYQRTMGRALWQPKFYDHILRRADVKEDVAWYIWMNPVRKGLCRHPREFLYAGSFTGLGPRRGIPFETWVPPWKKEMPA